MVMASSNKASSAIAVVKLIVAITHVAIPRPVNSEQAPSATTPMRNAATIASSPQPTRSAVLAQANVTPRNDALVSMLLAHLTRLPIMAKNVVVAMDFDARLVNVHHATSSAGRSWDRIRRTTIPTLATHTAVSCLAEVRNLVVVFATVCSRTSWMGHLAAAVAVARTVNVGVQTLAKKSLPGSRTIKAWSLASPPV